MGDEFPTDPDSTPTIDPEELESMGDDPAGTGFGEPGVKKQLGPYEIIEEIGRGGMGVVYQAFQPKLNRTVALKVLIAGEDASEEAIARFHREAEAVAKLGHHPNIVPVYDIGAEGNLHYFAMHYVEGRSLEQMIDEGKITPKRAAVITVKLAEALAHAHSHGILHRDIKPANVLMGIQEWPRASEIPNPKSQIPNLNEPGSGRSGYAGGASGESGSEPMLTDFGLAKDVESESQMTRSGVTLGTPNYMSPEQADGRLSDIDERSDVYSLGATFYEMLTSAPPFEGSTVVQIVQSVMMVEPSSPRKKNPSVEKDLETICLKCLEKPPERRYDSAGELAADLGRYLQKKPILAHPPSLAYRLKKRLGRHKALVTVGVLGFVAVAVVAAVFGTQWFAERSGREKAEEEASEAKEAASDAEAVAGAAQRVALEQLRKRAAIALSAALELRRAGLVDRMQKFLDETESAAGEAMKALPESPEPHYHLGRMYRATLREDRALTEQNRALEKDPVFAPSLYERVILTKRVFDERMDLVERAALRAEGSRRAASGEVRPGQAYSFGS
ncbi:MAG: serine/threonine-protein kinase, partial [Planctomycetota bacterium]